MIRVLLVDDHPAQSPDAGLCSFGRFRIHSDRLSLLRYDPHPRRLRGFNLDKCLREVHQAQ